ncbi:MAG: phosphoribosyltransferase family protein [Lachnospiraceae bacterium]|nr:phosphoribosyltransferase family protein [Lachnospiraceae bacterium]
MYTEQNLVRIAKRENNNKRKYLVVNRLQGKHIPVKPCEALAMFRALAGKLHSPYKGETLLVIGFAETATAIGAAVAAELGADYMQTTRERVPDAEYLYFSEEHSHAVEQKLVKNDIDSAVKTIDRILFVEDEVTTGKTILNIIDILKKRYSENIKFSVASILNGMDKAALDKYQNCGIDLFWLVKTDHAAYTEIADSYKGDGIYVGCKGGMLSDPNQSMDGIQNINLPGVLKKIRYTIAGERMDTRRLVNSVEYNTFCANLYQDIASQADFGSAQNILVLGTEEFMYPALYVAEELETRGKSVRFHATTRSPIAVGTEQDYPLHTRYELRSFYDSRRTTYIYDLHKYDAVVIITDAQGDTAAGMETLYHALAISGNERIFFFQL